MKQLFVRRSPWLVMTIALAGCSRSASPVASSDASSDRQPAAAAPSAEASRASSSPLDEPGARAEVGKPAPLFTLPDETGNAVSLARHKGKVIVLEWFNPDCPFVVASHEKGSLVRAAKHAADNDVVWLAVNSGAPGKQGHGAERNAAAKSKWSLPHPILLDESGQVGRAYGATNTPHVFVIDSSGVLAYAGAVDNSPDGEGESPTDGKLVSYVDDALAALAAGRAVATPMTKAYGCSVKYAR